MKTQTARSTATRALAAALVLGACSLGALAAYVELPDGRRVEGSAIRARPNGEVILTTPQGPITYQRGQYVRAVADRPAAFDQARALAARQEYDQAITLLKRIVSEFYLLEWDVRAQALMAQVHMAAGDPGAAVDTWEELFRITPRSASEVEYQGAYKEALLRAERFDKLLPLLERDITQGTREEAARAQIMRGDLYRAQQKLDMAVLDYLRTVVLFERQTAVQPEALFKAGVTLQDLRDPRAKGMLERLVNNYPTSPFAEQARGML